MAWKEVEVEDQRKKFIELYSKKIFSITELCRQFDISRPSAYKWIDRFETHSWEGLKNRSSIPLSQPLSTDPELIKEILDIKFRFPTWGPKKVQAILKKEKPLIKWPSANTIGNIFERNNLVIPRKFRRRLATKTSPLADCNQCNDVWCLDFKGWFLTKDNQKCEPFTLMDAFSRYLFCCTKLECNNTEHVWAILDRCFREYGLPLYLRSDNGPPFATSGPGRLSSLSIRLIKAGVIPDWIEPGKPAQNGRHERMHLTLKQEAVFANQISLKKQLDKFNEFIEYYNCIRPHEALNQRTPIDIYMPSSRVWRGCLKSPEYSNAYEVARVRNCGKMSFEGKDVYVSRVLAGEPIGIKENEKGVLQTYYGPVFLGNIEDYELKITRRKPRITRKAKTKVKETT